MVIAIFELNLDSEIIKWVFDTKRVKMQSFTKILFAIQQFKSAFHIEWRYTFINLQV